MEFLNTDSDEKRKSYAVIQISGHGNTPSVQDGNKLYEQSLEHGITRFFIEFLKEKGGDGINNNLTAEELASQVEDLVKEVLPFETEEICTQKSSAYFITAVPHGVSNMMFAGSEESLSSPAEQFRLLYKACDEILQGEVNKNGPITDEIFFDEIASIRQKLREEHTDLLSLYLKDVINAYNEKVIGQSTIRTVFKLLPNPFLTAKEKQEKFDKYNNCLLYTSDAADE